MTAPTSIPPEQALQAAMVTALKGDATLSALLSPAGAVYDEVPESAGATRYVTVGDHLSVPDNDLSSFGREVTVTLHVWTKAKGFTTGQAIANRINQLLDHQTGALNPAGHRVVSIRNIFAQAIRDPDQAWRHHILRFRINTEQE